MPRANELQVPTRIDVGGNEVANEPRHLEIIDRSEIATTIPVAIGETALRRVYTIPVTAEPGFKHEGDSDTHELKLLTSDGEDLLEQERVA